MVERPTIGRASPRRTFADVVGPAGLARTRAAASPRTVAAGEVLCHEGDRGGRAYLVEDGLVALTMSSVGGRQVLLELRGAGELVGELSAVDGTARSATVRVVEAGSVRVFPGGVLLQLARQDGDVAAALLVTLAAKIRESAVRRLELGTTEALARVARRLVELWALRGGTPDVASPVSQQELADWAGVSRDAVVRSLSLLRHDGVVATGRRRFTVLDPARLQALADG